jgi:hypothetical protein
MLPTPGAQCLGEIAARLSLAPADDEGAAEDAELGLAAVIAGDAPLLAQARRRRRRRDPPPSEPDRSRIVRRRPPGVPDGIRIARPPR